MAGVKKDALLLVLCKNKTKQKILFISKVYHRIMLSFYSFHWMWIRKPEAPGGTDSYLEIKGNMSFKTNNNKADTEKTKLENEGGTKNWVLTFSLELMD